MAAGKLRAIGIAAPERVPAIEVPTLKEQGIDVELVNWRAVFAPPGIKDKDLAALSEMVDKMVKSAGWQKVLKKRGWLDLYQSHDQFVVSLNSPLTKSAFNRAAPSRRCLTSLVQSNRAVDCADDDACKLVVFETPPSIGEPSCSAYTVEPCLRCCLAPRCCQPSRRAAPMLRARPKRS